MGGAAPGEGQRCARVDRFNRRGDSLGGAANATNSFLEYLTVSIAGAILWGVLPRNQAAPDFPHFCFNRRGDSLGGAALAPSCRQFRRLRFNRRGDSLGGAARIFDPNHLTQAVSIAGAILWGVLQAAADDEANSIDVSIAGAILWGVLPGKMLRAVGCRLSFNRRGDSLGGAAYNVIWWH